MPASKVDSTLHGGGLLASHPEIIGSRRAGRKRVHWPIGLFLITLVVPWVFYFGPLRMSVYRIVLLLMLLPSIVMWLAGKAGRVRIADIAVLLYAFWATLSLSMNHGFDGVIQSAGIVFIETVGPYLLARCYVRSADDFYAVVRLLFGIVLFLLPFALFEFVSGQNVSRQLSGLILPTYPDEMEGRLDLTRVQSVFEHAILFGVFTGSILALVYVVLGFRKRFLSRFVMGGIVAVTSILSISAGPLIALVVQVFLLGWNGLLSAMRSRWVLLIALAAAVVLVIELVANRSAMDIFVSFFLFDSSSYWFRKLIWMYGVESVQNHPLFGTGMSEWDRPTWMASSIDNFWLFHAVRYGLPAAFLMQLAFFSVFLPVSFRKGLNPIQAEYRTGFLITMTAFFLVAWTVHFWGAAYVLFMFLMGSGVWLLDVQSNKRVVQVRNV